MIRVPREFEPSSLLYYEQIPEDVQRLLDGSRDARLSYEWIQARERALRVYEIYKGTAHTGLALAQIHLADFYGDVGEIGEATAWCEKAHWIFQRQPSRAQQHNEAVATYALGILREQQLFRDPMGIWNLYQSALRQFQVAQEYWATCNNILQFEKCQLVRRYISQRSQEIIAHRLKPPFPDEIIQTKRATIRRKKKQGHQNELGRLRQLMSKHFNTEELRTLCTDMGLDYDNWADRGKHGAIREIVAYLDRRNRLPDLVEYCEQELPDVPWRENTLKVEQEASASMQSPGAELPWRAIFDVWEPAGKSPFEGERNAQGYVSGDVNGYLFMIKGVTHRLHPVPGRQESIALNTRNMNYYFALHAPDNRWADLGVSTGDYVFIRQQWLIAPDHAGIVWEPDVGWLMGDFERTSDGKIKFVLRSPRIIGQAVPAQGDPNEKLTGYIIGLLKLE